MKIAQLAVMAGILITGLGFMAGMYFKKTMQPGNVDMHYVIDYQAYDSNDSSTLHQEVIKQLSARIKNIGYRSVIKRTGGRRLSVTVFDVDDTARISAVIKANAKVEFRELYTITQIDENISRAQIVSEKYLSATVSVTKAKPVYRSPGDSLPELMSRYEETPKLLSGIRSIVSFSRRPSADGLQNYVTPQIGTIQLNDTGKLNQLLRHPEIRQCFPLGTSFTYGRRNEPVTGKDESIFIYALQIARVPLNNADILAATNDFDMNGNPEIRFQFNKWGTKKWERLTTENTGRSIAIVVNDVVVSAPNVNGPITGGSSSISGGFTTSEAIDIATSLQGALIPARLFIIEKELLSKNNWNSTGNILLLVLLFLVGSGFSYFILNYLKNK